MQVLAKLATTRPRTVILVWLVVCGACALAASGVFSKVSNVGFMVPGSDSERSARIYRHSILGHNGSQLFAVVTNLPPHADAATAGPLIVRRALTGQPYISSVAYEAFTKNGVIVQLRLSLDTPYAERRVRSLRTALAHAIPRSVNINLTGAAAISERFTTIARHDLAVAEKLALPVTFCLLIFAFRSIIAALLPLVLATVTLLITFALLATIGRYTNLSVFVINTASILGLGLSIDFSLFMVTRFRQAYCQTDSREQALVHTLMTTGRAIALSAVTITGAVVGLFAVGISLFTSMAIGAIVATLMAAATALTLLPALIVVLGRRIEPLRLLSANKSTGPRRLWDALARAVTGHPTVAILASLAALAVLAMPAASIQLSVNTLQSLPKGESVYRAAKQLGSPVTLVTTDLTDPVVRATNTYVGQIWDAGKGREGWASLQAIPKGTSEGVAARRAVERLRKAVRRFHGESHVGGLTAVTMDLTNRIKQRTGYVVVIVCMLACIILSLGIRSMVVPPKAVLSTLLSTLASLGVLARIFEAPSGSVQLEFFVPLVLFAVIFGVSTDYEIFLLSRIREAVADGLDTRDAVRHGLIQSARAISLAGLTLLTVFLAFASSSLRPLQQLGAGLAIAVAIDITIVRCVLVPASMVLLGRLNWWFPLKR